MVVVSHLFLFLWKSFRGRFDSYKSNLPLFGTIISRQPLFLLKIFCLKQVSSKIKFLL